MMARIVYKYNVEAWNPPEMQAALDELGAREDDLLVVFADGSVGFGRNVEGPGADELAEQVERLGRVAERRTLRVER